MTQTFFLFAIAILLLSLLGAILFLLWFFRRKRPAQKEFPAEVIQIKTSPRKPDPALKRWCFHAILWPLLCLFFAGIILYQSARGMEERFVGDTAFTLIPLIFFALGMTMRRRLLKERSYATCLTTATVVSQGRSSYGGRRNFFPEYEFSVGDTTWHVRSPGGYGVCYVTEGSQVTLYYDPENPRLFYVPVMQKHDRRWAMLLCGAGVLYPFLGLLAPQIRMLLMH